MKTSTTKIPMWDEDWIEIKESLTVGETTEIDSRSIQHITADGKIKWDGAARNFTKAASYLTAWSLIHVDGHPIPWMPGAHLDQRIAVLKSLDEETFNAIVAAIEAYEKRKNEPSPNASGGDSAGVSTSPSAVA